MTPRWYTIAAFSFAFCVPHEVQAYRRMPPQFLAIDAGYGLSSPYDGDTPDGEGGYVHAEYYIAPSPWFSPRAYAGLLMTFPSHDYYCEQNQIHCDVSAKIGLLGVKVRLTLPIPYVAPFVELGLGASIGAISTHTENIHNDLVGITYHIPMAIGLSLGEEHDFDLLMLAYFHPSEEQINGGMGLGFGFQIN